MLVAYASADARRQPQIPPAESRMLFRRDAHLSRPAIIFCREYDDFPTPALPPPIGLWRRRQGFASLPSAASPIKRRREPLARLFDIASADVIRRLPADMPCLHEIPSLKITSAQDASDDFSRRLRLEKILTDGDARR